MFRELLLEHRKDFFKTSKLCHKCRKQHSHGQPNCTECHQQYLTALHDDSKQVSTSLNTYTQVCGWEITIGLAPELYSSSSPIKPHRRRRYCTLHSMTNPLTSSSQTWRTTNFSTRNISEKLILSSVLAPYVQRIPLAVYTDLSEN